MTKPNKLTIDEQRLYFEIGFRVRVARETRDLTQQQLADAIDYSRVHIANVEAGRYATPLHTLYRISQALGVRLTMILPSLTSVQTIEAQGRKRDGERRERYPVTAPLVRPRRHRTN